MGAASQARANTENAAGLKCIAPSGTETCPEGIIRIGIFFDGTNNNMFRDWGATDAARKGGTLVDPTSEEANGPTNVAKLYMLFQEDKPIQIKEYFIGVGAGEEDSKTGEGSAAAQGSGYGGRTRIDKGRQALENFFNTSNFQLAKEKRVDTFGFSRGAAQARDFVNKVRAAGVDNTKDWNGEWKTIYVATGRSSVPVRVKAYKRTENIFFEFLGIFDTVGSFGLGALAAWGNAGYDFTVNGRPANGETPDKVLKADVIEDKEQWVHRTFHAIAEDEYREMFPLELMGLDPKKKSKYQRLPKYLRERPYPGAHADIGGGYRASKFVKGTEGQWVFTGMGAAYVPGTPDTPAKTADMANITLKDMWDEATAGHVPLDPVKDLGGKFLYEIPQDLNDNYEAYIAARERIIRECIKDYPTLADYVPSMLTDPVYIQALPEGIFSKIQEQRLALPCYQAMVGPYLHDENKGLLWGATGLLKRLTNWSRTFSGRRDCHYGAPQQSYKD